MHQHIYSFCGEPGCQDKPYHPNTEDLVSPALTSAQVSAYFADHADQGEQPDHDDYAIRPCAASACPNPREMWVFIRRNDPLMAIFRPQHYNAEALDYSDDTWARA